jgi:glycosyltransferase involved in cell wall biosynthesis
MRIGIDARLLSAWRGGSTVFLKDIVRELEQIDQENEYFLYSNRPFVLPFENRRWWKRVQSRVPFAPGSFWMLTDLKRMIVQDSLDVFWGPMQVLPPGLPANIRKVLTVLDFVWMLYPETMSAYTFIMHRLFHGRGIQEADTLVAISASTARDLERLFAVPELKIQVIHLGVRGEFRPIDRAQASRYIADKYDVSENYICSVGTIQPRKNVVTLVEAIKTLRQRGDTRHQLLVAGGQGWKESGIFARVKKCGLTERDVRFLGFVPDKDMPFLYSGAAAFAHASLYEGFGLPLVEAMACGAPIVASDAPPVPEIVGDAGLLVSPKSPEGFADALAQVIANREISGRLIANGFRRAAHFCWRRAAQQMLEVFRMTPASRVELTGAATLWT